MGYRYFFVLLSVFLLANSASAFMMTDVTEMVTAPFTLHRNSDNVAMPKFMQTAEKMFEAEDDEVDMSGYVKNVQQRISANFKPSDIEGSPTTVLLFKLTRTGRIDTLKVIKSSGDELFDHASVRAVQSAAPFDYLPSDYEKDILKVQITFTKSGMSINHF